MSDQNAQDVRLADTLDRIARTLGVPRASFFEADDLEGPLTASTGPHDADRSQTLALVHLFHRLGSPAARTRCLALIERELRRDA